MQFDPRLEARTMYREIAAHCISIRDVWVAVNSIPPDEVDAVLGIALREASDAIEDPACPEPQRRKALQITKVILDLVLHVRMGVPRSPDAVA